MFEIGSFLELDLPKGREYHTGLGVARLNSGRGGIFHASEILCCDTVWLPLYQCDTVRDFLTKQGKNVKYYKIDENFDPVGIVQKPDEAVVIVNYYGVMSHERMASLAGKYDNVIIDDSQAFFCEPVPDCMNVYSARKFVGVPDGCYVVGQGAEALCGEYPQDYSSDTSLFLLKRIEYGCEKTYADRTVNEERFDNCGVRRMSKLTHALLDAADYEYIAGKRRENFRIAHELFGGMNKIDPMKYYDDTCVPMVYPFVAESDTLLGEMQKNKIFQGHWWSYLLDEVDPESFEYWLSRYIIPITIDQRYGREEIEFCRDIAAEHLRRSAQ